MRDGLMPEPRAMKASGDELMETPTPKERLLSVLRQEREKIDRPPVICAGAPLGWAFPSAHLLKPSWPAAQEMS